MKSFVFSLGKPLRQLKANSQYIISIAGSFNQEVVVLGGDQAGFESRIFEGISVDAWGKQHYLDVHVAYRQACLSTIEYLTTFGYSKSQAYSILGTAPVQGHISGVVDIPNACATLRLPTVYEFDVMPNASGPVIHDMGGVTMPLSQDL